MRKLGFISGISLLFVVVLFLSCGSDDGSRGAAGEDIILVFDLEEFQLQQDLWLEQGLQNYSFHLRYDGFSGGPFRWQGTVAVKDGVLFGFIGDRMYTENLRDSWRWQIVEEWLKTIPDIFANTMDARNNILDSPPNENGLNFRTTLDIEYDSVYHFPSRIVFSSSIITPGDWVCGSHRYEIIITNFTTDPVLEPNVLSFDRETFEEQHRLWLERGIPSYDMDFHFSEFWVSDLWGYGWDGWEGIVEVSWMGDIGQPIGEFIRYGSPAHYWVRAICQLFDNILHDSTLNYGIKWGVPTQSRLEIEWDSEYNFPVRYIFTAEPLHPADQDGLRKRSWEFTISDFSGDPRWR